MVEEKNNLWNIDNKLIYSVTFLVALVTLKQEIINLLSSIGEINLWSLTISISTIINSMVLFLLISLYLYSFYYLFDKVKNNEGVNFASWLAGLFWSLFIMSPLLVIVLITIKYLLIFLSGMVFFISTIDPIIIIIVVFLFVIYSNSLNQKSQERAKAGMMEYLDRLITERTMCLSKEEEDKNLRFVEAYNLLEIITRREFLRATSVFIPFEQPVNLSEAFKIIRARTGLYSQVNLSLLSGFQSKRNKIVHGELKIEKVELEEILKSIRENFNLKIQ